MSKKGASHIDWVTSIGIFIIYVLLLLVWIKPGYQPVFEQNTLVNIVKNNIEKDHGFEVNKILLIAKGCDSAEGKHKFDLDVNDFKVVKVSDGTEVGYQRNSKFIQIYSVGRNEYWVISSDDFSYGDNIEPLEGLSAIDCSSVSIGEPVVKKGLSGFTLPGFNPSNWGFPSSREFKIMLSDFSGSDICYSKTGSVNCETYQPDSNVAVFASEWRYNVVNENGELKPVLVTILIW